MTSDDLSDAAKKQMLLFIYAKTSSPQTRKYIGFI